MHAAIPTSLNLALTRLVLTSIGFLLFALPILLSFSPWWSLILVPAVWLFLINWSLIHEAIHRNLHPDREKNESLGRWLSIAMGASYDVLRFGHLTHHQLNRDWQGEIVGKSSLKSLFHYYWTLLGGLYWTEVFTTFLMAVMPAKYCPALAGAMMPNHPHVVENGVRTFITKGRLAKVRTDALVIALVYFGTVAVYSQHLIVLIALLTLRALIISFFDNLYHYDTPADNSNAGKVLGLPVWMEPALLYGNYHGTHHRNPKLPWNQLKAEHHQKRQIADGEFIEHALMQFKGPICFQNR
ncbi:MAG: fatty acid desaturase [Rickettsiales bacterium]